jgi:hypothetical protein
MISDLLHGLDLHGDVEPVDDMFCRRQHGTGSRLRISAPSEIPVTSPTPHVLLSEGACRLPSRHAFGLTACDVPPN